MLTQVCRDIGPLRCAQQGQPDGAILNVIPVLAVVDEADAISMLRHIRETVAADFILRLLPACIAMSRSLDGSERNLISSLIGNDPDREADFQQFM